VRFATDTGGTFTDLVVEGASGELTIHKVLTNYQDPVAGILQALQQAADAREQTLESLLAKGEVFIHGTTHALNALITGNAAKTALLTTAGHPDILTLREGGRADPFDHATAYPLPLVPRALTLEVNERVSMSGEVLVELQDSEILALIEKLKALQVEAVAVCLLWSISNATHERRIGQLLAEHLPDIPFTLSHELNPVVREYRRASSACIDASLKPLVTRYLGNLEVRLKQAGFAGRVLIISSQGGLLDVQDVANAPIHVLNSGPSMAPIAGRSVSGEANVIIADTGGTTFDISIVRDGQIPLSREMWIGKPYTGHMTGFPSVDIKSIGSGGGSIAYVDSGGVLHVGPQSQGSEPGPACYAKGGVEATFTDACLVLGYLDPDNFLGGNIKLDLDAAREAIDKNVASPLGLSVVEAAVAICEVSTEKMCQAIFDFASGYGVDPLNAVLIGGGGAAGLNAAAVGRRLGCTKVIIPEVGATMSAAGALVTDISREFRVALAMSTAQFSIERVNTVLLDLAERCWEFVARVGSPESDTRVSMHIEAHYENQAWDIEVALPCSSFQGQRDVSALIGAFHREHERLFQYSDDRSSIEISNWIGRVECGVSADSLGPLEGRTNALVEPTTRTCIFSTGAAVNANIHAWDTLQAGTVWRGPAVVESAFTSVVIGPEDSFSRNASGHLEVWS
jgi:N-methylhydantoinase A